MSLFILNMQTGCEQMKAATMTENWVITQLLRNSAFWLDAYVGCFAKLRWHTILLQNAVRLPFDLSSIACEIFLQASNKSHVQ